MRMKTALSHVHRALGELAGVAEKLKNQNFADQIKAAAGKVQMALEHPDAEHPEVEAMFSEMAGQHELALEPPAAAPPFPGGEPVKQGE